MKWQLTEEHKTQYDSMLKSAQELESTIGSTQYRIHKLTIMREDVDKALKIWWEQCLSSMELDPKKDYMITRDGMIEDVTKPVAEEQPAAPSLVGTNAASIQ
jgi:hypothetical protein